MIAHFRKPVVDLSSLLLALWTGAPARDVARAIARSSAFEQSCRDRKRIEMLFAHLKRILRLGRLRLRGPCGAQFEFTLAAIAQNLRRLAKLVVRPPPMAATCAAYALQLLGPQPQRHRPQIERVARASFKISRQSTRPSIGDFCNKICQLLPKMGRRGE
jgi:hypothetical protein